MSRFWVHIQDEALAFAKSWAGWTVLNTVPVTRGLWAVEVDDPTAPAEAEGKLCELTFSRRVGRLEDGTLAPPIAAISDYGIPAGTP